MNVVTSDRAINIDVFDDNELLRPITDNTEIDNLLDITKDDKFKKPGWFSRGNHFYEGTLWIPLNVNYHMASVGLTQDQGDNKELDKRQQALDAANNWNTGPKI
jgi:hypothetical protein